MNRCCSCTRYGGLIPIEIKINIQTRVSEWNGQAYRTLTVHVPFPTPTTETIELWHRDESAEFAF